MFDRIIDLCFFALSKFPALKVEGREDDQFTVQIGDNTYTVLIEDAEVDEESEDEGTTLDPDARAERLDPTKFEVKDHTDILDTCLAAMAADPDVRADVFGLTTDGDGKDCEAIFNSREEGWAALKIR